MDPKLKHTVTKTKLMEVAHNLGDPDGKVDFICLGCPHYSIHEMQKVAQLLEGKQVHKDVTLWVCTSTTTAMLAESAGFSKAITDAGAIIMSGPNYCPVFGPGKPCPQYSFAHPDYSIGNFATDAVKQAYYARPNLRAQNVFLGSMEKCIEAAVSGEWKG
jgi:predicted aconitase